MNPIEKAVALLEAATDADLARLCGAERLMLRRQLIRWGLALDRSNPTRTTEIQRVIDTVRETAEPAGVLARLAKGERSP